MRKVTFFVLTKDTMVASARLQLVSSEDESEVLGMSTFLFNPCFVLADNFVRICVYESNDLDNKTYKSFCEYLMILFLRFKFSLDPLLDPLTGKPEYPEGLFNATKAVLFTKTKAFHFCDSEFKPLDLTHPFVYGLGDNVFSMFKANGCGDEAAVTRTIHTVPGIGFDVTTTKRCDMSDTPPMAVLTAFVKSVTPELPKLRKRPIKREKVKRFMKVQRLCPKFRRQINPVSEKAVKPQITTLDLQHVSCSRQ